MSLPFTEEKGGRREGWGKGLVWRKTEDYTSLDLLPVLGVQSHVQDEGTGGRANEEM